MQQQKMLCDEQVLDLQSVGDALQWQLDARGSTVVEWHAPPEFCPTGRWSIMRYRSQWTAAAMV